MEPDSAFTSISWRQHPHSPSTAVTSFTSSRHSQKHKKRALLLGKPVAFDFFEIPVSSACFQACAGFAPAAFKRPRRMSVILPPATTENTYPLLHIQHLLSVPVHCTVRARDGQVFLASRSKPSSITPIHAATTRSSYRVPAPFWISARASSMPRAGL